MLSASNTDRWPQVVEGQIAIHQRHRSHGSSSQMIRIKNCGEQFLSPDERLVATGGNSGIVTIWEVATAKPLRQVLQGLGENASREQPAPRPTAGSRFDVAHQVGRPDHSPLVRLNQVQPFSA